MKLIEGQFYHFYNQGNRRHQLFYTEEHYRRFIGMVNKYIVPNAVVMAYCLMPNHFHFMLQATTKSIAERRQGNIISTELANGFRMLQSSYAQFINNEQKEFGSLFKQKVQAKEITNSLANLLNVFCYIHQNPTRAGLVTSLDLWKHSSFTSFKNGRDELDIIDVEKVQMLLNVQAAELLRILNIEVDADKVHEGRT